MLVEDGFWITDVYHKWTRLWWLGGGEEERKRKREGGYWRVEELLFRFFELFRLAWSDWAASLLLAVLILSGVNCVMWKMK